MRLELAFAALKFLSIALSLGFGVLGLLTRYRDESGKITRWGRTALIGVFATGIIAAGSQSVELALSNRKAEAELEKTNRLLTEINRGLNPITDVRATYRLGVSFDHSDTRPFVDRLVTSAQPLIARWQSAPGRPVLGDERPALINPAGMVTDMSVTPNSRLFPRRGSEAAARALIENASIGLYFYRDPIPVDRFPFAGLVSDDEHLTAPDLAMSFHAANDEQMALRSSSPSTSARGSRSTSIGISSSPTTIRTADDSMNTASPIA